MVKKKTKTIKPKNPVGSPTIYNEKLANRICEIIANSPLGLPKLCKLHNWMPNPDTIWKWRYRHQEFADKYNNAKARQAELMVEDILNIADDGLNDTYIDEDGNVRVHADVIARSRLRVDTRKWYASKLAPKIYGDKQEHTHDVTIRHEDVLKELD